MRETFIGILYVDIRDMYGGTKIVPVGKTAFKRTRSLLGRTVDRYKQKFPRVFQFINFAAGL